MASMNISPPDPMKDWVEAQTQSGKYASTDDYVRDLIRRDQENREKLEALQNAITQGLDIGASTATLDGIWADVKTRHGLNV